MQFEAPQFVESPSHQTFFYHWMELPQYGLQPGAWDLRGRFADYVGGVDLRGKRVLDVGAASGFLSFSAEQAGASEVVSFDIDTADHQHLLPFAGSEYMDDHATWSRKQTAGFQAWKNAYWLAHRLTESKAKVVYGDVYNLDPDLGEFDVVILGAIIEHLGDPVRALGAVSKHARDRIVINTDYIDSEEPIAKFNGDPAVPDNSYVFWTYSIGTYRRLMDILGFEIERLQKDEFSGARSFEETAESAPRPRLVLVARRRAAH